MANTSLLGLLLPTTGTLNGTWGTVFNTQVTELLDSAIAGTTEITSDSDVVLTSTVTAANEARQAILLCTGARTAIRTVAPPSRSKTYVVINATTGGFAVTVGGVSVPSGKACMVAWDGSTFVAASSYVPTASMGSLTLVTPLAVASGGTGAATLTGLVVGNGASAMTAVAAPTGTVVGTTDTQTLTNKTISADDNTISGVAADSFVVSNADGEVDGSAAQKAIPLGVVVGTTDTQTLTNKTISVDDNTVSGVAASSFVLSNADGEVDGSASQKVIPNGPVVGTTDTQTLTNKRITQRVASITSGAAPTPDTDAYDQFEITALAEDAAFNAPTGTPTDGQKLLIRILDNGTSRLLTWATAYREVGAYLPTETVASKTTYVGCVYNSSAAKWDVVASITEA